MPCVPERFGQQHALAHIVAHGIDVGREFRVGQPLGEQVERFQDRQAGADQRDELLVEDQEFFEIELLAAAGDARSRPRGSARRFSA